MLFAVFGVLCFDGGYGGWVCWFIAVWGMLLCCL